MYRAFALFACASAFVVATPACASVTLTNYAFSGSGTGTMTLSYDSITSAYSLSALNLALDGVTFDLSNSGFANNGSSSILGSTYCGVGCASSSSPSFWLVFNPASLSQSAYGNWSNGSALEGGYITIAQVSGAVPEPATWAMMLIGFGAIGFSMRRARRAKAVHRALA